MLTQCGAASRKAALCACCTHRCVLGGWSEHRSSSAATWLLRIAISHSPQWHQPICCRLSLSLARSASPTPSGAWRPDWKASCSAPWAATHTLPQPAPRALRRTGEQFQGSALLHTLHITSQAGTCTASISNFVLRSLTNQVPPPSCQWGLQARKCCSSSCSPAASSANASPCRDDIDAFVLQVEGSKRWRLYAHTDPQHVLPRCAALPAVLADLAELPGAHPLNLACVSLLCILTPICAGGLLSVHPEVAHMEPGSVC